MSIRLSPLAARSAYVVLPTDDPFKKYWWAILAGFALTGVWMCVPLMGGSIGSTRVETKVTPDASNSEQSLDIPRDVGFAPGEALDSGHAVKRQKRDTDAAASMLYQAPPESGAAASGVPIAATATKSAAASLAQQLKDVGRRKDDNGWGGEKAQRGFTPPRLSGALSGLGSTSGGSSASAGGSYFGAPSVRVGETPTVGLRGASLAVVNAPGFQGLRGASAAGAPGPAGARSSAEAAHMSMSGVFDGAKSQAPRVDGKNAMASARAALDAAPANLKANDPKLEVKKLPEPPSAPTSTPDTSDSAAMMGQQFMMMMATALIGGLVPGLGSQLVTTMGTMMMQQQQQRATAQAAAQQSNVAAKMNG